MCNKKKYIAGYLKKYIMMYIAGYLVIYIVHSSSLLRLLSIKVCFSEHR